MCQLVRTKYHAARQALHDSIVIGLDYELRRDALPDKCALSAMIEHVYGLIGASTSLTTQRR